MLRDQPLKTPTIPTGQKLLASPAKPKGFLTLKVARPGYRILIPVEVAVSPDGRMTKDACGAQRDPAEELTAGHTGMFSCPVEAM